MKLKLNLGCGRNILPGYINIDYRPGPGVDLVLDLDLCQLPFGNGVVDEILLSHTLEHLVNRERFMIECHRVLKKGCCILVRLPVNRYSVAHQSYTHGKGYFAYMASDKWNESGGFYRVVYEKRRLRHIESLLHRLRNWFYNLFTDEWEYLLEKI